MLYRYYYCSLLCVNNMVSIKVKKSKENKKISRRERAFYNNNE